MRTVLAIIAWFCSAALCLAAEPIVHPIPPLPGHTVTAVYGLSVDGTRAAGVSGYHVSTGQPITWTEAGGTVPIPLLPGCGWGQALDANATGFVVGWQASTATGERMPFWWHPSLGVHRHVYQRKGWLYPDSGCVLNEQTYIGGGGLQSTARAWYGLPTGAMHYIGSGRGVVLALCDFGDGRYIYGGWTTRNGSKTAFVLDYASMVWLSYPAWETRGISPNGTWACGITRESGPTYGGWIMAVQTRQVTRLPAEVTAANAVSDAGMVVGVASGGACTWTAAGGIVWLADCGTFGDLVPDEAVAVSADGTVIAGNGEGRGWVAEFP